MAQISALLLNPDRPYRITQHQLQIMLCFKFKKSEKWFERMKPTQ